MGNPSITSTTPRSLENTQYRLEPDERRKNGIDKSYQENKELINLTYLTVLQNELRVIFAEFLLVMGRLTRCAN